MDRQRGEWIEVWWDDVQCVYWVVHTKDGYVIETLNGKKPIGRDRETDAREYATAHGTAMGISVFPSTITV